MGCTCYYGGCPCAHGWWSLGLASDALAAVGLCPAACLSHLCPGPVSLPLCRPRVFVFAGALTVPACADSMPSHPPLSCSSKPQHSSRIGVCIRVEGRCVQENGRRERTEEPPTQQKLHPHRAGVRQDVCLCVHQPCAIFFCSRVVAPLPGAVFGSTCCHLSQFVRRTLFVTHPRAVRWTVSSSPNTVSPAVNTQYHHVPDCCSVQDTTRSHQQSSRTVDLQHIHTALKIKPCNAEYGSPHAQHTAKTHSTLPGQWRRGAAA